MNLKVQESGQVTRRSTGWGLGQRRVLGGQQREQRSTRREGGGEEGTGRLNFRFCTGQRAGRGKGQVSREVRYQDSHRSQDYRSCLVTREGWRSTERSGGLAKG